MNDRRENQAENTFAFSPDQEFAADSISFEELLNSSSTKPERPTTTHTAPKKKKKKGNIKAIIWIIVIVMLSVGLAYGVLRVAFDYLGVGFDLSHGIGRSGAVDLDIKAGTSTAKIAKMLDENDVINCPNVFRLYSKLKHYDGKYRYGLYHFERGMDYDEISRTLTTEGMKATDVQIRIPAYKVSKENPVSSSIAQIADLMEQNHVCYASDFRVLASYEFDKAILNLNTTHGTKYEYSDFDYDFVKQIPAEAVQRRLEGYLLPETYHFLCHSQEEYDTMPNSVFFAYKAIDTMLSMFDERLGDELRTQSKKSGYSVHELVTMASIVQQEAGTADPADAARVARVFYNRLEGVNWEGPRRLESDPTKTFADSVLHDTRYDTYSAEGLPPGPILLPEEGALHAVANPASDPKDQKVTYFVTDAKGQFYFNETYSGHLKTIADLKAKGLWLYTRF